MMPFGTSRDYLSAIWVSSRCIHGRLSSGNAVLRRMLQSTFPASIIEPETNDSRQHSSLPRTKAGTADREETQNIPSTKQSAQPSVVPPPAEQDELQKGFRPACATHAIRDLPWIMCLLLDCLCASSGDGSHNRHHQRTDDRQADRRSAPCAYGDRYHYLITALGELRLEGEVLCGAVTFTPVAGRVQAGGQSGFEE